MKYTLTALLGLTLVASAQEPPRPGDPAPAEVPDVPGPVPEVKPSLPAGLAKRAEVLDPFAIVVPEGAAIEKPNMTGLEAAQLYEDHTGKRVIMSSQASQAEVFFVQRGPLTNNDIARYLKAALMIEGLAILPDPLDPNMVRILPSGPVAGPGPVPKQYITDPLDLPTEDQLVIYKMFFEHLKPEEAERIFQSAVGQLSPSGKISAVTNASSLLITENSSLIRQLIKIKDDIDVASKIGERWVEVVFADVDEVAERLNEIYNEQGSNRSTTRNTRTTTRGNAPPAPGTPSTGGGGAGEDIPIKIIPDNRTNRILLVGRPAELIAVEALVRNFDVASSNKNSAAFRLRYMRVGEFLTVARDAILSTQSETAGAGGAGGGNRLPTQANNGRTNQVNQTPTRNGATTGGNGGGGGQASIQAQEIPTAPESELIGKTHLVGDNISNTIIVNGPPHHIEIVRNLVRELDTESQQIALSTVVGAYALGEGLNFGVDLAQTLSDSGAGWSAAGRTSFGVPSIVDPASLGEMADLLTAAGSGGQGVSVYGLIGDDFGVFINALESGSKFQALERSVLMTRNNRVANLSSGQRIAVPSSTFQNTAVGGGQTTNIEYINVVLDLEIQPLINSDNEVTLEISLVRDSVGQDRVVGELIVPDITTEELTTSVTVIDGSAVILGGLITEGDRETRSGWPVLSRIPGIGRLFGYSEDSEARSELIIMIRPQIINGADDLAGYRDGYEATSIHSRTVRESFPPTSMLPPVGEMPPLPPQGTSKSGEVYQTPPAPVQDAPAPKKKGSLIRSRGGSRGFR